MTRTLIATMALAAVAGCGQGDAQEKKAAAAKAAPPTLAVSVIAAAPREVPVVFEAVGRTEGSREVQVRARVTGILERQLFAEGDTVKAGAPLFRIERAPFEIELQQARGALALEQARLALAQQELERLKGLADRRAISQKEADQAASGAQQGAASVQIAEARLRQAELNLSYTTVDAPIAGATGRALQSVGSLVAANAESSLLTTLMRADPIWVRFALSEAEFARLRARDAKDPEVKLEFADGSTYAAAGKLNFSGSAVDPTLGTVQMRAEFPNAGLQVLPGQYVRVRVLAGTQQAIVVPQGAVMQDAGGRFVYLMGADNKVVARNIRAGAWLGGDWVVLEGLQAGDTVIVDNHARLRPGLPVQANKAG